MIGVVLYNGPEYVQRIVLEMLVRNTLYVWIYTKYKFDHFTWRPHKNWTTPSSLRKLPNNPPHMWFPNIRLEKGATCYCWLHLENTCPFQPFVAVCLLQLLARKCFHRHFWFPIESFFKLCSLTTTNLHITIKMIVLWNFLPWIAMDKLQQVIGINMLFSSSNVDVVKSYVVAKTSYP